MEGDPRPHSIVLKFQPHRKPISQAPGVPEWALSIPGVV